MECKKGDTFCTFGNQVAEYYRKGLLPDAGLVRFSWRKISQQAS